MFMYKSNFYLIEEKRPSAIVGKRRNSKKLLTRIAVVSAFYLGITPFFNDEYFNKTSTDFENINQYSLTVTIGKDDLSEEIRFDKCEIPVLKTKIKSGTFWEESGLEKYSSINRGTMIKLFTELNGSTIVNPHLTYRSISSDKNTWNCYNIDVNYRFFPSDLKLPQATSLKKTIEEKLELPQIK